MLGLFVVALAWRAIVLSRLADGPLLTWLTADAAIFWNWAGEIRSGEWIGSQPFFLGPLYPYWLALARFCLGDEITRVLGLQIVLGSVTVLLVADAARRIATPGAGVVVGAYLAGYGMAVFFDVQILMESLLLLLGSLALWLIARGGRQVPVLVGAIVGLMALGRPTFLLLLPLCAIHTLWRASGARLATLGAMLVVPTALVAATAIHHWRVDRSWIPITYSGGFNLYVGNGPRANGTFMPISDAIDPDAAHRPAAGGTVEDGRYDVWRSRGLRLSAGESARYWLGATLEHIADHPQRALYLLGLKTGLLFNHREASQITDAKAYERAVGALGWPLDAGFAFLAVGGALGLPVAWRRRPGRFLIGWLVVLVASAVAFFVIDRYRLHLVPVLALLTALGIESIVVSWRERRWRSLLAIAGLAMVAGLVTVAPLIPYRAESTAWSHATMLGNAWLVRNEPGRALEWYRRARDLDRSGNLEGADTPAGRRARAALYENLGMSSARTGDAGTALASLATATRLAPDAVSTRLRYAELLALNGLTARAAEQYGVAGLTVEEAAERLVREAERLQRSGDLVSTREYLEAAAQLQPSFERAVIPLIRLDISSGRLESARTWLRAAEESGIDPFLVTAHQAWVSAAAGDTADARRIVETIPGRIRVGHARVAATLEAMSKAP
jgi:hypothetical protein